jgi:hypothetical protein
MAKHHGAPAYYCAEPFLVHRLNNSLLGEYHVGNFFDYAVTLPALMQKVLEQIGAPGDFFEQMTGDKRIVANAGPGPSYVDAIFENLLRSMGGGRYFTVSQRRMLESILVGCRPERVQQLGEIWNMQEQIHTLDQQLENAKAMVEQGRQACLQSSQGFVRQG